MRQLIRQGHLKAAFKELMKECSTPETRHLRTRLENLEQTYNLLIHYLFEGVPDPGRSAMLRDIKSQLLEISDELEWRSHIKDYPSYYYSCFRDVSWQKDITGIDYLLGRYESAVSTASFAEGMNTYDKALRSNAEMVTNDIFKYILTLFPLTNARSKEMFDYFTNGKLSDALWYQSSVALTLGCLHSYDRNRLRLLLRLYRNFEFDEIKAAHILTDIVLIIAAHRDRVVSDEALMEEFAEWKSSILIYSRLRTVILNILKTHQTDKLNDRIKNEIIPQLKKISPTIMKRFNDLSKDMDSISGAEENPEWESILEDSGLADQMRELQEAQIEGGDLIMSSMAATSNLFFFKDASNWFLPFDRNNSQLASLQEAGPVFDTLINFLEKDNSVLCDSDKYGFALSLTMQPEQMRKMMSEQLGAQLENLKEMLQEKDEGKAAPKVFDSEVALYVRQLHRFFRQFENRKDFPDALTMAYSVTDLPLIADILCDTDTIKLLAEYNFKHGFYDDALKLYLKLEKEYNEEDSDAGIGEKSAVMQKIGYCYETSSDVANAMHYYELSEMLGDNSRWLLKRLAALNRNSGNFDKAIGYYNSLLEDEPENTGMLMSMGSCLLQKDRYAEALQYFYKVTYLKPDHLNALRAIAWAELLSGNTEKSIDKYAALLQSPAAIASDWLNAGHASLVKGDMKEAIRLYASALRLYPNGIDDLYNDLIEDIPYLKSLDVDTETVLLIPEKLDSEK